jgi:hypothetical protein
MVVTFDIPINLPTTRNYVVLIEFDNYDGNFDYSMGWSAVTTVDWVQLPCIGTGFNAHTTPVAG